MSSFIATNHNLVMLKLVTILLLGAFAFNRACASPQQSFDDICNNIIPQESYLLHYMTGTWYGIEILEHQNKGRATVDNCIKVELIEREKDHVTLIWRERKLQIVYTFQIEEGRRGIWISKGYQTVTGDEPIDYHQFAGKVYVLKASDNNAVLTFCSLPNELYSLVLSKSHHMNDTELESIHNLVTRLGVPKPKSIRKFCKNRADTTKPAVYSPVLLILAFHFSRIST